MRVHSVGSADFSCGESATKRLDTRRSELLRPDPLDFWIMFDRALIPTIASLNAYSAPLVPESLGDVRELLRH